MPWFWKRSADRRKWQRVQCRGTAAEAFGRTGLPGAVTDLCRGGCLFHPAIPPLFLERQMTLTIGGERLKVRLVRKSRHGQHLCFLQPLDEQKYDDIMDVIFRERRGILGDSDAVDWLATYGRRRPPGRNW